MNGHYVRALAIAASVAILAACSGGSTNQTLPSGTTGGAPGAMALNTSHDNNTRQACATIPARGFARCFALVRTDVRPAHGVQPNVSGYGPADLQSAYNLPSATNGSGQTIAVVDAFDDPNAEADLGVYRSNFGLSACTTGNGCFKKVDQNGGTSYPSPDAGWAVEMSLDVDMASAVCPNCKIVLVEANDNSFGNLGKAVNQAVLQGAKQISNSYGGSEFNAKNKNYNHKHVVITASSGDSGYAAGPQQPCSYSSVVCVGGTGLTKGGGSRGWSETAWHFAGSGCSAIVVKPTWQHDTGCSMRTESDISAVASPSTGVAVYDTYHQPGWIVVGGTSVSSPIIASVFALAGNSSMQKAAQGIWNKGGSASYYDVTTGNNGTCGGSYLCTAGPGYDGPTGWGTPNGVSGF